jgi:hypothetical protein
MVPPSVGRMLRSHDVPATVKGADKMLAPAFTPASHGGMQAAVVTSRQMETFDLQILVRQGVALRQVKFFERHTPFLAWTGSSMPAGVVTVTAATSLPRPCPLRTAIAVASTSIVTRSRPMHASSDKSARSRGHGWARWGRVEKRRCNKRQVHNHELMNTGGSRS